MADFTDLFGLIDDKPIDVETRRELRAMLVAIGNDPVRTVELAQAIKDRNDALEAARVLLQWIAIFKAEGEQRIEDYNETTKVVAASAIVVGGGAPFGALALVATLGSGGVVLVAIAGMGIVGLGLKGMQRMRYLKNLERGGTNALGALESQLRSCEGDIIRRQGG